MQGSMLRNIVNHQHLVWAFVLRDLRGRYIGSVMGLFWSIIHPLSQIIVFSVIFSMINRGEVVGFTGQGPLNYTIFLCSALLPWIAFQELIGRVTNVFVGNANLIKKVQFPEEILVIQELISSMITMLISYSLFFLIILVFGGWTPPVHFLLLPGVVALQVLFSLGFCYFLATLNVYLRDIGQITAVVLMTWFWLTPIVYPVNILFGNVPNPTFEHLEIPRFMHTLYTLNPWYYLSKWYREVIYIGRVPEFNEVMGFTIVTIVFLSLGIWTYKKLRNDIPDLL
jgi:lipopolysaccharide transport system permease protein